MQRFMLSRLFNLVAAIVTLSIAASTQAMVPRAPQVDASSYILMDANSGQVIMEYNADEKLPPASLTKMMTAYIVEDELTRGNFTEDDMVPISVKAWRMGGSRMFIQEGTQVSVGDLLKGVVIPSGNDSSVALAEYIAGSEDAFSDLMNQYARRLGMTNTNFTNSTGWPDDDQYSTSRDMAILARAIILDFPQHYDMYAQKEFTFNNIRQQNRNLLLWRDPSVDGLKTGHTRAAGYCLVASAERDGMRLISVVMGTESEAVRARESMKMLNYGFRFFETYTAYNALTELDSANVWLGKQRDLALGLAEDLSLTIPRDSHERLQVNITTQPQLQAPIEQGAEYGTLTVSMDGDVLVSVPLIALHAVEPAGIITRMWHHLMMFIKGLFN